MKISSVALFALAAALPATSFAQTTLFHYDLISGSTPALDGWAGANVGTFVFSSFESDLYIRNNTGTAPGTTDSTITKSIGTIFSTVDDSIATITIDVLARGGGTNAYWQLGLGGGGANANYFGVGSGFVAAPLTASDAFLVFNGGARTRVENAVATNIWHTFSLTLDLANSTYAYSIDGTDTGITGTFDLNTLKLANNLTLRQSGIYGGLGEITITATPIPEPSAAAGVAGLAVLGAVMVRRRRR